ncbi:MAG: ADP-ribosylglycohydrolase family protein [Candidatus Micrarchaeaceae archaeon]
MNLSWLYIGYVDLQTEYQQLIDEGRDISSVKAEFIKFFELNTDSFIEHQEELCSFFDRIRNLPFKKDYPYDEPSDLNEIRRLRPQHKSIKIKFFFNKKDLYNKILGAWLGRCAGCLLGKPVEGWKKRTMWEFLKDLNLYPLTNYFHSNVSEDIQKKYQLSKEAAFINRVKYMVEDDDINYTVAGLEIVKKYGFNFTPMNVAEFWLNNLPVLRTCTAERIAYRNICNLIYPPFSATFHNPYREWIGAQIRADFFGYVTIGYPQHAAELAWKDASISHIKNGIYGEMWVAAMLAVAPIFKDPKEIIMLGLSEIPENCRLSEAIKEVIIWYKKGIDYKEVIEKIHKRWDENNNYHWGHVISNAQIVTMGLLWGEGDFEKSICQSVEACFDTDCNGATVGSIVGMMLGAENLPPKWINPLNNKIETGISGYPLVKISKLARDGFNIYLNSVSAKK